MAMTNAQIWDYLRGKYPTFKSQTSKATSDLFTERGFEQLRQFDSSVLNSFFDLSMRVYLQQINVADVKDLLESQDFGEAYDQPYGGYTQRMAIDSVKPVSPAYNNLKNGDSPDPFVVRKANVHERFWVYNFDYASLLTIPDDKLYKNIFVSQYGMSEYQSGMMRALANGYKLQQYNNKLAALNQLINSTEHPLKASQKYEIDIPTMTVTDVTTADGEVAYANKFIGFIQLVRNLVDAMVYNPATGIYNVAGFETTQDKGRLRMLCRPELANAIETIQRLNNADNMSMPIDIVRVPDFGGLIPKVNNAEVYPVYDNLGAVIGYATTKDAEAANVDEANITWDDPNKDVLAIIADKGVMFTTMQNPYQVEPIRNPRGLYTNYWASSPHNGVHVDTYYNVVTIRNSHSA